jgi:hypothetical protein
VNGSAVLVETESFLHQRGNRLLGDARYRIAVDANAIRDFLIRSLLVRLRVLTRALRSYERIVLGAPILRHLYVGANATAIIKYVTHGLLLGCEPHVPLLMQARRCLLYVASASRPCRVSNLR